MKRLILLIALLLALPAYTLAADGDRITSGANTTVNADNGAYWSAAYIFCDGHVAADGDTCAEFDLNATGLGMPHHILFSLDLATSCTAGYQVVVNGHTTTALTAAHTWGTLNAADTALIINSPVHRFIAATTIDTGCATTGLTVNMTFFYAR